MFPPGISKLIVRDITKFKSVFATITNYMCSVSYNIYKKTNLSDLILPIQFILIISFNNSFISPFFLHSLKVSLKIFTKAAIETIFGVPS